MKKQKPGKWLTSAGTPCLTRAVLLGFVLGIVWMSNGHGGLDGKYFRVLETMAGSGVD